MVGLWAFLPAGCDSAFYRRILFLDVICKVCVHVVGAGGFRVESEDAVKFSEDIIHNPLFILHGEHPDAEILCLILFTELLAGKAEKGEGNLIAVHFVVIFGYLHSLLVKERRISHVYRDFQPIFMGKPLLGPEDVERFCQKLFIPDIFLFSMASNGSGVLRNHFRPVDHVKNKFTHSLKLLFH